MGFYKYQKGVVFLKSEKKMIILYAVICIILIGLSFLSFLFNEWIMPLCTFICSIFGMIVLLLLIKSRNNITPESGKGSFVIYMVLRFACMLMGLVLSFLLVKFTMGEYNKLRYVMALVSALPFFVTVVPFLVIKQDE